MLEFIAHYWIQVLFGLIVSGIGFLFKHHWKIYKQTKDREQKDFEQKIENRVQEMYTKSQKDDEQLVELIKVIKNGLLSVQGDMFKNKCETLLQEGYKISIEEYEQLTLDHDAYNNLGGNHEGDRLFELVEEKVKKQI